MSDNNVCPDCEGAGIKSTAYGDEYTCRTCYGHKRVADPQAFHRAKLCDPDSWSRWPVLPVKRYVGDSWPELGLVLADVQKTPKVYIHNLFELKSGLLAPQLKGCLEHVYDTLDAMLADGWIVD